MFFYTYRNNFKIPNSTYNIKNTSISARLGQAGKVRCLSTSSVFRPFSILCSKIKRSVKVTYQINLSYRERIYKIKDPIRKIFLKKDFRMFPKNILPWRCLNYMPHPVWQILDKTTGLTCIIFCNQKQHASLISTSTLIFDPNLTLQLLNLKKLQSRDR